MLPFEQGGLDSLCGIYSIINAEKTINKTTLKESQELFNAMIDHLDRQRLLVPILTSGMLRKHIKSILDDVIGDRIPYKKMHFAGVENPDLNTYWNEIKSFLAPQRAVILCVDGFHDHWTVAKEISDNRIELFDSTGLRWINRANCTTYDSRGKRHHIFYPAQTYFLKGS